MIVKLKNAKNNLEAVFYYNDAKNTTNVCSDNNQKFDLNEFELVNYPSGIDDAPDFVNHINELHNNERAIFSSQKRYENVRKITLNFYNKVFGNKTTNSTKFWEELIFVDMNRNDFDYDMHVLEITDDIGTVYTANVVISHFNELGGRDGQLILDLPSQNFIINEDLDLFDDLTNVLSPFTNCTAINCDLQFKMSTKTVDVFGKDAFLILEKEQGEKVQFKFFDEDENLWKYINYVVPSFNENDNKLVLNLTTGFVLLQGDFVGFLYGDVSRKNIKKFVFDYDEQPQLKMFERFIHKYFDGDIDNVLITPKTVSFDSKGGTLVPSQSYLAGTFIDEPEVSKNGFALDGWYLDGTKWDFENDLMPDKNIILKAVWI